MSKKSFCSKDGKEVEVCSGKKGGQDTKVRRKCSTVMESNIVRICQTTNISCISSCNWTLQSVVHFSAISGAFFCNLSHEHYMCCYCSWRFVHGRVARVNNVLRRPLYLRTCEKGEHFPAIANIQRVSAGLLGRTRASVKVKISEGRLEAERKASELKIEEVHTT